MSEYMLSEGNEGRKGGLFAAKYRDFPDPFSLDEFDPEDQDFSEGRLLSIVYFLKHGPFQFEGDSVAI